jgi:hypothetical protein
MNLEAILTSFIYAEVVTHIAGGLMLKDYLNILE